MYSSSYSSSSPPSTLRSHVACGGADRAAPAVFSGPGEPCPHCLQVGADLASNGGTILNPSITFQGMMDATYKIRNVVIIVSPTYGDVMLKGGTITVPVYQSGSNAVYGIAADGTSGAIRVTAAKGTIISGNTIYNSACNGVVLNLETRGAIVDGNR